MREEPSWREFWALVACTVAVVILGSALLWWTDPYRGKHPVNCQDYGWYKTCEWVAT